MLCGPALEVAHDAAHRTVASADNHMHVLRQDCAGVHNIPALAGSLGKTAADGQGLLARKGSGRMLQCRLGLTAQMQIVGVSGNRACGIHLRGFSKPNEFPGAHEIRP